MPSRAKVRSQNGALVAFVRAWDEFINASHHLNNAPSEAPAELRTHLRERVTAKQREVERARRRVGALDE